MSQLKMAGDLSFKETKSEYVPLRRIPGVSGHDIEVGSLCHKYKREAETPTRVLRKYSDNSLLITYRTTKEKHKLINLLKERHETVCLLHG